MYANAVDDSIFLSEVVAKLENNRGEALAFASDHGENLLDDRRAVFRHALRYPTRPAIRVPVIFFWLMTPGKRHTQQSGRRWKKTRQLR